MLSGFGLGNQSIYGQQAWQRKAQEDEFRRRLALQMNIAGSNPMLQARALYSTALGMNQESGGSATAFGVSMPNYMREAVGIGMLQKYPMGPFAGQEGAQDWYNKMQTFRFPSTFSKY
jgi:hypothetical protein